MCTCNDGIPERFLDHTQPVTDELLTALAEALGIKWPEWHRRLIVAFCGEPPSFLFEGAGRIYQSVMLRRAGESELAERVSSGEYRRLPWPPNLIGVGSVGNAEIVIDTTSESGDLLQRRYDGLEITPFANLMSMGPTPEAVAEILMAHERVLAAKRAEELKWKQWEMANPIFRGPPPGTQPRMATDRPGGLTP